MSLSNLPQMFVLIVLLIAFQANADDLKNQVLDGVDTRPIRGQIVVHIDDLLLLTRTRE